MGIAIGKNMERTTKPIQMPEKENVTLHDIMPQFRGNQTHAADYFTCNRATIKKYLNDKDGEKHTIIKRGDRLRIFSDLGRAV